MTNTTSLSFIVFFDKTIHAIDAARSAGKTYDITEGILPIIINNKPVTFGENDTSLVRNKVNGDKQISAYP